MKYKKGDLIVEEIEDHLLIILTEVKGKLGQGYIIDGTSYQEEDEGALPEFSRDEPYFTNDDSDTKKNNSIDLNECQLVEEANTLL